MFFHRCVLVCCTSVNKLFVTGLLIEIQHDVSYRAKFLAAVRLWRTREEEKRVWKVFRCTVFYFRKFCCEEIILVRGKLTVMFVWLCLGPAWEGCTAWGGLDSKRQVHPFQPNDYQVSRGPHISPWEKIERRTRLSVRQGVSGSDRPAQRRDKDLERSGRKYNTIWASNLLLMTCLL